jgi:hypothetical protein
MSEGNNLSNFSSGFIIQISNQTKDQSQLLCMTFPNLSNQSDTCRKEESEIYYKNRGDIIAD